MSFTLEHRDLHLVRYISQPEHNQECWLCMLNKLWKFVVSVNVSNHNMGCVFTTNFWIRTCLSLWVNLYIIVLSFDLQVVLVYEYDDINWTSLDDVQAGFYNF